MSIVNMKDMLRDAQKKGVGIGAFEFWSYDSAAAVIRAAEKLEMPVILQAGKWEAEFAGGYESMTSIFRYAAEKSPVPVALHLDHSVELEEVYAALEAGFTSVMIDSSAKSFDENVADAVAVVERAKKYGATVEAELGRLEGNEGEIIADSREACQTDPMDAKRFVEVTGIDALAVSVGTVHGFYDFTPELNIERLKKIRAQVDIPLVLHGGSGTPDDDVVSAIKNGICKINICTEFIAAYGKAYGGVQTQEGFKYSVPSFFEYGRDEGCRLAYDKIKLFACK